MIVPERTMMVGSMRNQGAGESFGDVQELVDEDPFLVIGI